MKSLHFTALLAAAALGVATMPVARAVPIANAREIYDWLRIGNVVWVEE